MKSCLILLSRDYNSYLYSIINHNFFDTQSDIDYKIILDSSINDNIVYSAGFFGLTQMVKQPSAWDKAFYIINQNKLYNIYDYFYFMEDDVYCADPFKIFDAILTLNKSDQSDFISREIETKQNSQYWHWWSRINTNFLKNPTKSFNPFCRISNQLIIEILNFKLINNKFIFHEILFASLAKKYKFSINDINNTIIKNYFGKFIYRPLLKRENIKDNKIYHPVKPDYTIKFKIHDS